MFSAIIGCFQVANLQIIDDVISSDRFFFTSFGDFRIFASYMVGRRMGVLRLCLAEDAGILTK